MNCKGLGQRQLLRKQSLLCCLATVESHDLDILHPWPSGGVTGRKIIHINGTGKYCIDYSVKSLGSSSGNKYPSFLT